MSFFHAHPLIVGLGAYFLFSNVVGAMEKPDEKSSALYKYIFRLSHGLAGNLKYALQAKFPGIIPLTQMGSEGIISL